jgi:prophage tail gpP-like protein
MVRFERNGNPPRRFKFTASEQVPLGEDLPLLQIMPPDPCQIILDGYPAIDGYVTTRQAFYNGVTHEVEIQGESWVGWLNKTPATSQTHELQGPAIAMIQQLAAPAGVGVVPLGNVMAQNFPRFSITPGESAWEAIEKIARMSGLYLSSDASRNLIVGGQGAVLGLGQLVEGVNIVEARETIHTKMSGAQQTVIGQSPRTDNTDQSQATQGNATIPGFNAFGITPNVGARSIAELPAFMLEMLQMRGRHEASIAADLEVRADVTHAGWEKPGAAFGSLWEPFDQATVDSQMLVMKNMPLIVDAVTYVQNDHDGTRTTVELTNDNTGEQPIAQDQSTQQQPPPPPPPQPPEIPNRRRRMIAR